MSTQEELRLEIDNTNLRTLLAQAGLDMAEQKTAERLMRVMFDELHHRLKNNLAIVTAIVHQSLRNAQSLEHGRHAIETRLTALGRAHDVLLQGEFASAKLSGIVTAAIAPFAEFGEEQFIIESSDRDVTAAAVLPLTLILNEFCTNATKYGALSVANGRVHIEEAADNAEGTMLLIWREENGPPATPPRRTGFGTRLIEALASQMHGRAELHYDPAGFSCEILIPVAALRPV
jgi:two-component sensor histidine kinase